jgi:formylglycine-generating enzyme required for sulfatase activity
LHAAPDDPVAWLALADALEEEGRIDLAEITRLTRSLLDRTPSGKRKTQQSQLFKLLLAGHRPVMPEVVNSLGMRFVLIPPGSFLMGTSPSSRGTLSERQHRVHLTKPFYLGVYPVTQKEYRRVTRTNPSYFSARGAGAEAISASTAQCPVEEVSWQAAVEFAERLSARAAERRAGRVYRLPTEAEWEYACRAGSTSRFFLGNKLTERMANYNGIREDDVLPCTTPVGQYPCNAFGLYDMIGNVWEWCSDWFSERMSKEEVWDPVGPESHPGNRKVLRGGSCFSSESYCRTACRFSCVHDQVMYRCRGFRLVLNHSPDEAMRR